MRVLRFLLSLIRYIFIGNRVNSDIYNHRILTCNACDKLLDNTCTICGCNVNIKAKWSTESCPKNKW